jgi:hypothetical protein
MAVGWRVGHRLGGDRGICAHAVFDKEIVTEVV